MGKSRSEGRELTALLTILPLFLLPLIVLALLIPELALAGRASVGQLLMWPCDRCHPIGSKPLPFPFEGHKITLIGHDKLGEGEAACLVCHDSATRNPGVLKTGDGSTVNIDGDVSQVCYRCHSAKYKEWKVGLHGKPPKCTTGGCHDPHTPGWIAITPIQPFLGTSIEVELLSERKPFTALSPPSDAPPVKTPPWLKVIALVGIILAGSVTGGPFILERLKR